MSEMQTTSTLLSWMTFTPLIGVAAIGLVLVIKPLLRLSKDAVDNASRFIAVAATLPTLGMAYVLWRGFDPANTSMQFVHHFVWIKAFNIEYFLGVDGLSITLVILTALVSSVAVIASLPWGIEKGDEHGHGGEGAHPIHFSRRQVPGYMALLLLLETGMFGVFTALDFFLFYVFWELVLLPMYFLIGIWGGPRREYAAIKFFLYTLAGSVFMLLGMIALYFASGKTTLVDGTPVEHTFNIVKMMAQSATFENASWTIIGLPAAKAIWVGMFVAFAIKVPMFPFHTWLPDAHVEAPTPISVILAGILLKMGTYGMLRVNMGILPESTIWAQWAVAAFGAINIVYAAFVCMAQKDMKKLIAYSSVSHMGFVLLGMAAFTPQAITGAVYQMWTHGIVSPALFLIAGVIYDRAHHREIEGFGGLAKQMPEYTAITGIAFMASLGLPGLIGFISEALVFLGSFPTFKVFTIISASAVVITAAYYLWTMQRMFLGKLNEKYAHLHDLNWRERLTLYPLVALIIVLGFFPMPVLDLINPYLHEMVRPFMKATQQIAGL